MQNVDVVVIGAGATGAGVARDLALRGVQVALVESGDLACGTSGRNHGLLHSGGRYAVNDPSAAEECIRENTILRRVAAHCIDPCGGIFVAVEGDDPDWAKEFGHACKRAGIEAEHLGPRQTLEVEPSVSEKVRESYRVPDAAVDPFFLCLANAVGAAEHGATVLTHHEAVGFVTGGGAVRGVKLKNRLTGEQLEVGCRMAVNAAGPWAGKVAGLAGLAVDLVLSRGALVITRGRLVRGVVNRLRPPANGDIIVPGGPVCLLGTTSVTVQSPDDLAPSANEVPGLVEQGRVLVPGIASARIIREFTGIRPLYREGGPSGDGRKVSRGFVVIDHGTRDGLEGMVTVVGGKLTTYRLMAEKVADVVAVKLGVSASCCTAEEPLPGSDMVAGEGGEGGEKWPEGMPGWEARSIEIRHGSRAKRIAAVKRRRESEGGGGSDGGGDEGGGDAGESDGGMSRMCVCESVPEAEVRFAARSLFARTLDDVRRRTRMGMGPCQGSTCAPRAAAVLAEETGVGPAEEDRMLAEFLEERRKGRAPVFTRGGAAQEELIRSVHRGIWRRVRAAREVKP